MNWNTLSLAAVLVGSLVVAGSCDPSAESAERRTAMPDNEGVDPIDPFALEMPAVFPVREGQFVTSMVCRQCHSSSPQATAMRDSTGASVAPFDLWQGTMMANAARDPLWRAMVSAELASAPESARPAIEAKCMRCHSPMASESGATMSTSLLNATSGTGSIARDGVACALCHQIDPENIETEGYFNGGFVVGDENRIYGPFRNVATGPMQAHTGYTPQFGQHITNARLCASCHTLFTNALNDEGSAVGPKFPEQTPYLEWENSDFVNEPSQTCQGCHMGYRDDEGVLFETRIARSPPGGDFNIPERSPFAQHIFVGGNTLIPAIIRDMRVVLNPQATDAGFNAVIERTRRQLQEKTADLEVSDVELDGGALSFDVKIVNRIGHKFPTGFPARRAWLHVRVEDADGGVLFESGGFNDEGRLLAMDDKVLDIEKAGGPYEPHRALITRDDEVQIYESVLGDMDGLRTPRLTRAASYLKDNRVLPRGWSAEHPDAALTAPAGEASADARFAAGEDVTRYELVVDGEAARVLVELRYQSVGARFVRDLFQVDTEAVRAFRFMYKRADLTPELIGSVVVDL